jgi:hypothetical protein
MTQPILIVGAGPVGLTLAMELTRYGVPVRIVDKATARTDKSKALVLWSRTLELLDRGPGAQSFVEAGFKVNGVNLISREKIVGTVDMSPIDSPYPYALMLPQSETERLLEGRLNELGVKVERSVEATALSFTADKVDAVLRRGDGTDQVLKGAGTLTTIGTLHSPLLQNLRNVVGHALLGLASVQQAVANNMAEVSIGYSHSPMNGPALAHGGPKPGARVAPVSGQTAVGAGDTPRFTLMAAPTPAVSDLVARSSKVLDPDIRAPAALGGIWLVRPDGYVACSTTDPKGIADYLHSQGLTG